MQKPKSTFSYTTPATALAAGVRPNVNSGLQLSLSLFIGLIISIATLISVGIIISPVVIHIIGILLISVIIISR